MSSDLVLDRTAVLSPIADGRLAFFYRGSCMRGTFRPGDVLLVSPIGLEQARAGDVVVFSGGQAEGEDCLVVHRVLRRTGAGLVTRGDLSPGPDLTPVAASRLVGRVDSLLRGNHVLAVRAGFAGRWRGAAARHVCALADAARRPYRLLQASGVVRRLWRPRLVPVRVGSGDGVVVKYLHGRRTVAHWRPHDGYFWCRKPYDLAIRGPRDLPDRQPGA